MTETNDFVVFTVHDFTARIILNRPEKRNALNEEIVTGLKSALLAAATHDEVRVVLISGAGKDFCSGADLSSLKKIANASVNENVEDARSLMELFLLIRRLPLPVVAAVQGKALAGGCGLATGCDIVLASASARFGYPEVKIGFVPAMVMTILRRNVAEKRAFELLTLGQEIDANKAKQIGIVNEVFSEETFGADVENYLQSFQSVSPSAVTFSKQLLYQIDGMTFDQAMVVGLDVNVMARMTADYQKGIAGFLNRPKKS